MRRVIVNGFVAAPATSGQSFGAEIMGDDGYTENDSLGRKLDDAHLISVALELQSALHAVSTDALHEKRAVPGLKSEAEQMMSTALANSEGKA